MLAKLFSLFFFCRIHVYLLFFFLILTSFKESFSYIKKGSIILSLVFTCTMIFFHTYNSIVPKLEMKKVIRGISILFFLLPLGILRTRIDFMGLYLLLGVLTVVYGHPLFKCRSVLFLKNLMVSLFWSLPIALVPFFLKAESWDSSLQNFVITMLFVLCVDILCDVHDMKSDKKHRIQTLPNHYGLKTTRGLLYGLLVLIAILMLAFSFSPLYLLSLLPLLLYVWFVDKTRSQFFYDSIYLNWVLIQVITMSFDL